MLGTGLMGYPMAERLLAAKHAVCVYNRTRAKAGPLAQKGATVASSAKEAVESAACVILMLADIKAIEKVLFGEEKINLAGKTVIQMGTIAPRESIALAQRVIKGGGEYLECPVLGSRGEAAKGGLILMVGSTKKQFRAWQGFLKVFGPQPLYIGEVGKAAAMKLALNQLIASHAAGFSLSLGIVEKSGVAVETFMNVLNKSPLCAKMFEKKLGNWLGRKYDNPNFPVKHLLKDVGLIIREAKALGLSTDVIEGIDRVLQKTVDKGLGEKDYSALFNAVNNI
ncbi:MAG: hydroxyacid dehydrogenase [Omnitrophica WOR_2 bacterium RIFCSPHIGHO2_02_FULL_52_10]|nr:MAG: hydroxyacid dehydrogenase [Omnitrophica WOR_2 bacterium RIFCSPHIGHO2_02_FULL_52_10]